MRLLRRNEDDERVLHDVDLLSRRFAADAEGEAAELDRGEDVEAPRADAAAQPEHDGGTGVVEYDDPLDAVEDPLVRTAVRASIHVRRYLPFYAGAALWLGAMVLIQPLGDRAAAGGVPQSAFPRGAVAASSSAGEAALSAFPEPAPPSFGDIGATPADSGAFSFSTTTSTGFAAGDGTTSDDFSTSGDFSTSPTFDAGSGFDTPTLGGGDVADEPEPLRITRSGYSSATAGPLEQAPPGNGLPVAAVGGQPTKRSFVQLSGDETVLRLALVDDPSNVGAEQAIVKACPIVVDDWAAARGQAFEAQPAFSEPCVTGVRGADGTFAFDLSSFGEPGAASGFALVPASGATDSFNLTFDPASAGS